MHTKCRLWVLFGIVASFAAPVSSIRAQPSRSTPRLGFVYPAGAQRGTSVKVAVGGQNLGGATRLIVSGDGVTGAVIDYDRPLLQKEINALRDKLQKLQEKRDGNKPEDKGGLTPAERTQLAEIREKLAARPSRPANPALAETVNMEVVVHPNAKAGRRELRLLTSAGLSNPIGFFVGELPERTDAPVIATTQTGSSSHARGVLPQAPRPTVSSVAALPCSLNGQILPGEADRWVFHAKKGQHIVIEAKARGLNPYLADAVPGWFQATLALFDSKGRELGYSDDGDFDPDPMLNTTIPEDGDYLLEIKDALYRGREDFVYRISVGELPFVSHLWPLGVGVGERVHLEVAGVNLPKTGYDFDASGRSPGLFELPIVGAAENTKRLRFLVDAYPSIAEKESNGSSENAQPATLPVAVNGCIDTPFDRDAIRFDGRQGERIVVETYARRLGSPLDSVLEIVGPAGNRIAVVDDTEDRSQGWLPHQADSQLIASLPSDGTYVVLLSDAQSRGGSEYGYRLQIRRPAPDFQLRVVPSTLNLPAGTSTTVVVHAIRRDGFAGEIDLRLTDVDGASGLELAGARLPRNADRIRLTLRAGPQTEGIVRLAMEGTAVVEGKKIVRRVLPADDVMQAFAYHHLVEASEWIINVAGRGLPLRVAQSGRLQLPPGGLAYLPLDNAARRSEAGLRFELSDPPEGVSLKGIEYRQGKPVIVFACDSAKAQPGLQGNLIVVAYSDRLSSAGAKGGNAPRQQRNSVGVLPAIPFEIGSGGTRAKMTKSAQ